MDNINKMNQEREGKILEDAIQTWGEAAQIIVAIEEMSELTKALTKFLRFRECASGDPHQIHVDIQEEMADVGIMLNQLALIFGDPTEAEILKLIRLEQRIRAYAETVYNE